MPKKAKIRRWDGQAYQDINPVTNWDNIEDKPTEFKPEDHAHMAEDIIDGDFTNINTITLPSGKMAVNGSDTSFTFNVLETSGGNSRIPVSIRNGSTTTGTATGIDFINSTATDPSHHRARIEAIRTNAGSAGGHDLKFAVSNGSGMQDRLTIKHDGDILAGTSKLATEDYVDSAVIADTNNYVDGISGDGNSTLTLSRSGLSNLTQDLSHNHPIGEVTNLQSELDGKSNTGHNHSAGDITSGTLSVNRGGTGSTSFNTGQVLIGQGLSGVTTLGRSGIDTRSSFPPSSHTHTESQITDLDKYSTSEVDGLLSDKANLDGNGKVPLGELPDTAKQQTYVRDTFANLPDGAIEGEKGFVTGTGNSYIWDGSSWLTLAEADWENVNIDWTNLTNKPETATRWPTASEAGALPSNHAASNVTSTKISNWDTAYGWGDHSAAGYLTSAPSTNLGTTRFSENVTITSSTGSNTSIPLVNSTQAGLMSYQEHDKLDGIDSGAQVNVGTNLSVGDRTTTQYRIDSSTGDNVSLLSASTTEAGLMSRNDKVKLNGIESGAEVNVGTNIGSSRNSTSYSISSSTGSNTSLSVATTSVVGVMSPEDKSKLDGIDSGAQVNVGTNLSSTNLSTGRRINSSTGNNVSITDATTSVSGWMSPGDKSKLNGIETGAEVNEGTNLSVSRGFTTNSISSSTGSGATLDPASTSEAGLMRAADKSKLDGIDSGANNYTLPSATENTLGGVKIWTSGGVLYIET